MRAGDNIAFAVFIVSVSAMDSQRIVVPIICCVCSLIYLKRRAGKYGSM